MARLGSGAPGSDGNTILVPDPQPHRGRALRARRDLEAARDLLGREPAVRSIEALKFGNMLLPEQSFDLEVTLRGPDRLRFRLVDGDIVFASGRCVFGDTS